MEILAIADDTTGALEVGGQLASEGVRALVALEQGLDGPAAALVIDAQTRHLDPLEARLCVARLASAAREAGTHHIYKKTDSTLRGNVAVELQALLDAYPERPLVYVPAYPKMGRTVRGGELLVDGQPLAQSAMARDPLNSALEGCIPRLLGRGCSAQVHVAGTATQLGGLLRNGAQGSVLVCDGATDDDLRATASVLAEFPQPCIVAGTGGFVRDWASGLRVKRDFKAPELRVRNCLVISGSLHPASREQVLRAASGAILTAFLGPGPGADAAMVRQLAQAVCGRGWAALATPGTCPFGVGRRFGDIVGRVLEAAPVDCLGIFGGDTALAVLRSIGVVSLESAGELMPGIPLSLARYQDRRLWLVTKAGGFGGADTLLSIKGLLEKKP